MTEAIVGAGDLAEFREEFAAEWLPAIEYLSSNIGPQFDRTKGTFLVRLMDYRDEGYTVDDFKAACRAVSSAQVQARFKFPEDWLREFAEAITAARTRRETLARREADRQKRAAPVEEDKPMTMEEEARITAMWEKAMGRPRRRKSAGIAPPLFSMPVE